MLLVAVMGLLGMGNGAVFQLVPQRFPKEIGVMTGIVGAAGGVGGFFLPTLLGGLKQVTGSFGGGFLLFALVAFGCAVALFQRQQRWEGVFVGKGGRRPPAVPQRKRMAAATCQPGVGVSPA